MNIFTFLIASPRFLAFGFLVAVFSSFGQTYFIALSGAEIRSTFGLSHGDFGSIYSLGTLSSAALLVWAGRKIDDVDLRPYTSIVCFGLALACLGMANVSSALWLIPVIFALRFTGQGLMSHISTVAMARYFDAHRGKAISIASLGYPVGEAILPFIAVSLIATIGWREMWGSIGIMLAVGLVPMVLWLLKGHSDRHQKLEEATRVAVAEGATRAGWSRRQVLRDPRFYVLLPSYLSTAFIITGFFFHQVHLVDSKGWSLPWFAGTFVAFAVGQIIAGLITGIMVDRYNALLMMRFELMPIVIALLALAMFSDPLIAIVFMVFAGATSGAAATAHGAIWAEIYGVAHLGAIKAMGTALMVVSSALSPPIMGWAIDAGVSMETIAAACALYCIFAFSLVTFVYPRMKTR